MEKIKQSIQIKHFVNFSLRLPPRVTRCITISEVHDKVKVLLLECDPLCVNHCGNSVLVQARQICFSCMLKSKNCAFLEARTHNRASSAVFHLLLDVAHEAHKRSFVKKQI